MSVGAIPAASGSPGRWVGRKVPLQLIAPPPEAAVSVREKLSGAPAWAVSAAVHVAVLAVLAGITIVLPAEIFPAIVSEISPEEIDRFKVETVNLDPEIGNDSAANVLSPSKAASTNEVPPEQEMQREMQLEDFAVALPAAAAVTVPSDEVLTAEFDATGLTEYTGGVEGAIDVLTREIAASLRENRTTVVWLLDASLSLAERREKIAERVEAVYAQLGATGDVSTDHLESAVATFGGETHLLTPDPTDDPGVVVDLIRSVEPDESGKEYVFAALKEVGQKLLPERTRKRRNLMFVIVTDEKGDDPQDLENVIAQFKRYGIPVYCVGNAAPFGRDTGYVMHSWKEGFIKYIRPLPVDAGPETVLPERLRLGFWGPGGDVGAENLSSGYGPYALTRLCVETGGMYLVADDTNGGRFDPTLMKSYPPDYRPIADYTRDVRANRAKQALVDAAGKTKAEGIPSPQLVFPAVDDNRLRREVDRAQRPMALIDYRLQELQSVLEAGEPDRDDILEPRWRAGFDLALGRVLAQRARALGYNTMLAEMKSNPRPFERENSNEWLLRPAGESDAGGEVSRLTRRSRELLEGVIDRHPGTPWAMLARKELDTPLGWAWKERNNEVLRAMANGATPEEIRQMFAPEEEREMMRNGEKKGPRNPPKL